MGLARAHGKHERAIRPARRRPAGRAGAALFARRPGSSRPAISARSAPAWIGCAVRRPRASSPMRRGSRSRTGWPRCACRPRTMRRLCSGSACSSGPSRSTPPSFLPDPAGAWAGAARPLVSEAEHGSALAAVKAHIEAGDCLSGQSHLPGRGPHRRPSARPLRGASGAGARRPWRDPLHRRALDPQPVAGAVLHAGGRAGHDPADEGHRPGRRRPGNASRRSQAARRKSDDRRSAQERSVARGAARHRRGARIVRGRNLSDRACR